MGAGKLVVTTIVPSTQGDGEPFQKFGPDDDVPEWAARQMGAHCFEDGVHPYPDADAAKSSAPAAEEKERAEGTPPPKAGAGSGRDNWLAYADEVDVEIPKGTQRDAIISMIADAGKPVDPQ